MNRSTFEWLVDNYESPKRVAVSKRFPVLKKPAVFVRRVAKKINNIARYRIARTRQDVFFKCVVARHQSVLIRKLGDSDQVLQKRKITNLIRACRDLNGLVINPGQIFSMWEVLGNPTRHKGYVDGMLLSNGRVVEGIGGGLCQLSNFLCWIFLHADTEIIERYHHSMDVFPDSGRVLPFGSGATCLFNFVDFKILNTGDQPLQLKIWTTETHLKGQLLSPLPSKMKFSIEERNHVFIKKNLKFFRYNEIWRTAKIKGTDKWTKKVFTNFAPVMYQVDSDYLHRHDYPLVDLTK